MVTELQVTDLAIPTNWGEAQRKDEVQTPSTAETQFKNTSDVYTKMCSFRYICVISQ